MYLLQSKHDISYHDGFEKWLASCSIYSYPPYPKLADSAIFVSAGSAAAFTVLPRWYCVVQE
jgi:hypothetical protein